MNSRSGPDGADHDDDRPKLLPRPMTDEYGGFKCGGLPVNFFVYTFVLCCNDFQMWLIADN